MPVSGVHLISLSPLPYKLCVFFFSSKYLWALFFQSWDSEASEAMPEVL